MDGSGAARKRARTDFSMPAASSNLASARLLSQLLTQRSFAWVGVIPEEQFVEKVPSLKPPESIRFCVMVCSLSDGGLIIFYV